MPLARIIAVPGPVEPQKTDKSVGTQLTLEELKDMPLELFIRHIARWYQKLVSCINDTESANVCIMKRWRTAH
jgi:hypothetical protein